jgi:hypothetical protein
VSDARAWVHRGGVLLIGFAAAALGGLAGFFAAFIFSFGCHSDTSSTDSVLCEGSVDEVIFAVGWGSSIAAPLIGMIWSVAAGRWGPLWIGIAGSVLVLLVLLWLSWKLGGN